MKKTIILLVVLASFSCRKNNDNHLPAVTDYPIQPVPFTAVKVTDNFWANRIRTNHRVTIPIAIQKSRETGRIDNFKIAGGLMKGTFCSLYPFDDSDIYKIIEGAAYSLQMFPDPKMEATIDSLIDLIALAQEDDGYLYTNRTIMGENAHEWAGKKRWEKEDNLSHELYNLGHFYEAATAYFQATGKRKILDIAIKSADLVDHDFGWGKIENWPGHQEVEIGLVKLYRLTGEKRYLDLAKFFLDVRGRGIGEKKTYNQSHLPVVQQRDAVGHAVRATYMYSGMADVAALTGDTSYVNAIKGIWEDVVCRKLYITGGIGAEGGYEGFGGPYELPNAKAYCETCAAIANVYWNYRMFLMSGDSRYIDVLERSLYNNVLSGVSMSGDHFFYPNPLESHGQHSRSEWFGCACCPSNISRFIPSMPNYIYARSGKNIYVNLYVSGKTSVDVTGTKLGIEQNSQMPWDGKIQIIMNPVSPVRAKLHLRIPAWATNNPFPGELYNFSNRVSTKTLVKINGNRTNFKVEKGYAIINRKWQPQDKIELELPFEIRKINAHPDIADDRGKMAIQLGPVVYCLEAADYNDPHIFGLMMNKDTQLKYSWNANLLGGVNVISGPCSEFHMRGDVKETLPSILKAIPYYAWSHRGFGQMEVWIPSEETAVRPKPEPTIASSAKIEASVPRLSLIGINDLSLPANSKDETNLFYHWWPEKNKSEWIIYRFASPVTIASSSVYWFRDYPDGGCGLPESWELFYLRGEKWVKVHNSNPYPVLPDQFCKVNFDPVTTSAFKLAVHLPKDFSSGIHEWTVE